jgi:hypothetical protein
MFLSYDTHAQAVRDRQAALRRDADVHRLATAGTTRRPLAERLRCVAARYRLAAVAPEGCDGRAALSGSR